MSRYELDDLELEEEEYDTLEEHDEIPSFDDKNSPRRMSSRPPERSRERSRQRSSRGHSTSREKSREPPKSNTVKIILALAVLFAIIGIFITLIVIGGIGASSEGYHNRVGSFMTENIYYPFCDSFLN
jgi:hypothetical protein